MWCGAVGFACLLGGVFLGWLGGRYVGYGEGFHAGIQEQKQHEVMKSFVRK